MKSRVVALSESLASFDAGMFHLSSFTLLLELIEKYIVVELLWLLLRGRYKNSIIDKS